MRSAHIGVVVQRPVHEVYAFAREPDNLPGGPPGWPAARSVVLVPRS